MAKLSEKSIRDIIDKRQRISTPDMAASWRMSSLLQTFNAPQKHRNELLRYFPIAVVAAIDGYFRSRLAQLIDSGDPFLTNAVNSYPNVTIDTALAGAIAAKKVGLGELLMHPITIGTFETLIQVVTKVTGIQKFLDELTEIRPTHLNARDTDRVIRDPVSTWSHLGKVFELRHILCHELAADLEVNEAETRGLLLTAQQFMAASAEWLNKLQFPVPRPSRRERLRLAEESRTRSRRRLEKRIDNMLSDPTFPSPAKEAIQLAAQKLDEYQKALDKAHRTFDRSGGMYDFYDERTVTEHTEAMNRLASRFKLSAMMMGVGEYADIHAQGDFEERHET